MRKADRLSAVGGGGSSPLVTPRSLRVPHRERRAAVPATPPIQITARPPPRGAEAEGPARHGRVRTAPKHQTSVGDAGPEPRQSTDRVTPAPGFDVCPVTRHNADHDSPPPTVYPPSATPSRQGRRLRRRERLRARARPSFECLFESMTLLRLTRGVRGFLRRITLSISDSNE